MCIYIYKSVSVWRWGNISTLIVATGTVWIIQQRAPLNVVPRFPGPLAFPPLLLTSQLDSDTKGKHVSGRLRAQLPEVRVQADRSALRWPIRRETALLFFTSRCPSEMARGCLCSSWRTALMHKWYNETLMHNAFYYFALQFEKRQRRNGGRLFSWH